jgi:hypothetical protein
MPPFPLRVRLIDNWRDAHHFVSMHLSAGLAAVLAIGPALLSTWGAMPDDLKQMLPNGWGRYIAIAAFVLVAAGHYVRIDRAEQGKPGDGGADQ